MKSSKSSKRRRPRTPKNWRGYARTWKSPATQEKQNDHVTAQIEEVSKNLEKLRKRPAAEFEGRATAQELAMLERSIVKGARELYGLQLMSVHDLRPLDPIGGFSMPQRSAKLKTAVEQYADLRRETLHEWARPKLTSLLDVRPKPKTAKEAEIPVQVQ